ncbi:MAG: ATP-binding protein, partial [Candidatus Electrothrix sp. AUS1_2]|nr:ATP-binding protein [Candidatus Electrothrix sp. AUS1_2]
MSLDIIVAKIKEAESKWEQISKKLAFMEEQRVLETRPEERFRIEHEIKRMKQERQELEQTLKELHKHPARSNIPQQSLFFGRTKELTTIAEAISPEARTWGVLIDGPGGIGKTALAIRAGHDAPARDFERRIFLSAKVRELTPTGEQPLDDFSLRDYLSLLETSVNKGFYSGSYHSIRFFFNSLFTDPTGVYNFRSGDQRGDRRISDES